MWSAKSATSRWPSQHKLTTLFTCYMVMGQKPISSCHKKRFWFRCEEVKVELLTALMAHYAPQFLIISKCRRQFKPRFQILLRPEMRFKLSLVSDRSRVSTPVYLWLCDLRSRKSKYNSNIWRVIRPNLQNWLLLVAPIYFLRDTFACTGSVSTTHLHWELRCTTPLALF
jgi:hypothetical protein